jgi:ribosomal protein S18 acetylase RimI-like enzyme
MKTSPTKIEIRHLSITPDTVSAVQKLFEQAPRYFKAIQGHVAGPNEAQEALTVLPPNTRAEQKIGLGVYQNSELVGYVDLIDGYPTGKHAYLGLLLLSENKQRAGLGREAFQEIEKLVQSWPHIEIFRLGVADSNNVTGFWAKMGFAPTGRLLPCHQENIRAQIIEMEKRVSGNHGN